MLKSSMRLLAARPAAYKQHSFNRVRVRAFASTATGVKPTMLTRLANFAQSKNGMITLGATAFAAAIGITGTKVMSTFVHLNFYTVFEVGFVAGMLTSAAGFGFFTYFQRVKTIDVEKTMADALEIVQASPEVAKVMGLNGFSFGSIQTGTVRTYQIEGGHFTRSDTTGLPVWSKPKLQLMFQVWGGSNERQAVVCCEATTKPTTTAREFSLVSFDLLEARSGVQGKNPTVIVVGDESKLKVRDDLRSFVTLHRVYVKGL